MERSMQSLVARSSSLFQPTQLHSTESAPAGAGGRRTRGPRVSGLSKTQPHHGTAAAVESLPTMVAGGGKCGGGKGNKKAGRTLSAGEGQAHNLSPFASPAAQQGSRDGSGLGANSGGARASSARRKWQAQQPPPASMPQTAPSAPSDLYSQLYDNFATIEAGERAEAAARDVEAAEAAAGGPAAGGGAASAQPPLTGTMLAASSGLFSSSGRMPNTSAAIKVWLRRVTSSRHVRFGPLRVGLVPSAPRASTYLQSLTSSPLYFPLSSWSKGISTTQAHSRVRRPQ